MAPVSILLLVASLLSHSDVDGKEYGSPLVQVFKDYWKKFERLREQPTTLQRKHSILLKNEIKELQGFVGIKEIGGVEKETKISIKACGMKEKEYGSINNVLFRSPVNKWFKQNLTYSIVNYTNDLPRVSVHLVIARAFKYWEDVTPLKFHAWRNSTADILIKFVTGSHGDGFDFDGPHKSLGHAFPPPNGDVHFDDDETFTDGVSHGTNLLWVAVHEIGHALGLRHSSLKDSVMNSMYPGYQKDLKLSSDDILKIQALYGTPDKPKPNHPSTSASPTLLNGSCININDSSVCEKWKKQGYCSRRNVRNRCTKACTGCTNTFRR